MKYKVLTTQLEIHGVKWCKGDSIELDSATAKTIRAGLIEPSKKKPETENNSKENS